MNNKPKKALKIAGNVILWLFVAFAVLMTTMALAAQSNDSGIPTIGGKCFLTVQSDSMSGTFEKGDMLVAHVVTDTQQKELKEGQIITFYAELAGMSGLKINTHRIYKVNRDGAGNVVSYITWGDNRTTNPIPDSDPVPCNKVISVWDEENDTRLPAIGSAISFLQTPKGFLICIVLPLVLVFIVQIVNFVKTLLAVRGGGKKQITAADEELIKQRAIEEYLRKQAEENAAARASAEAPEDNAPQDHE